MGIGPAVIAWSIRLSMLLLVTTLLMRCVCSARAASGNSLKLMWTTSFALFVLHVIAAFHFVHHWSHQSAYQSTARETLQLMNVEFGGGVYFNYLFMIVWAIDVALLWYPAPQRWPIVRLWMGLGLAYLLFIAFNGIVVFKSGWIRYAGLAATVALTMAAVVAIAKTTRQSKSPGL